MPYVVHIKPFNGPLDLLLQLIQKAQVDIADIFVSEITEQYLKTVEEMEFLDMDSASEFLAMAATLMEIKSRKLLPVQKDEDELDEEDPQIILIRQLEEYQRIKQVSDTLSQIEQDHYLHVYQKLPEEYTAPQTPLLLEGLTLERLCAAFERVYQQKQERFERTRPIETTVDRDSFTIQDRIFHIQRALKDGQEVNFSELLSQSVTRMEIVTTFMALLELLRLGRLRVSQDKLYGEITIQAHKKPRAGGV